MATTCSYPRCCCLRTAAELESGVLPEPKIKPPTPEWVSMAIDLLMLFAIGTLLTLLVLVASLRCGGPGFEPGAVMGDPADQ